MSGLNVTPSAEYLKRREAVERRKATRADLETVALAVAAVLAELADQVTSREESVSLTRGRPCPDHLRRVLLDQVDKLRRVLPADAELTIDQRPLF